jgi:hypothetical protein
MGMEKVVPPRTRSSSRSPFSSTTDVNKPLPHRTRSASRSPFSRTVDKDKPLPERPRRSSSSYTADRGHPKIADTYSDHNYEDEPPVPLHIQPTVYQESISALLRRRLEDPPSPRSVPSAMSVAILTSQTSPRLYEVSPESPAISAISMSSAADSRNAPSFKEFSRNLKNKRTNAVGPVSPPSPAPQTSPDFRAFSYESTRRSPSISPRTLGMVDLSLVPAPLFLSKHRNTENGDKLDPNTVNVIGEEEKSESRFSSSSDDSYIIYTSIRASVKAYVGDKMDKKCKNAKKERKRVMSVVSAKYSGMLNAKGLDRKNSSASRKGSIQQGISTVYDKISKLSISGPSDQSTEDDTQPRGRKKQLAIPTSAYQKYGEAVWEAPKWRTKTDRDSAPAKPLVGKNGDGRIGYGSMSAKPAEAVGAFRNGRIQIIHALDGTKHKLTRSNSERRREALKQSIKLVGPADEVSDGTMSYHV